MKRKALVLISLVLAMLMLFPSVVGAFKAIQVKSVSLSKTAVTLIVGKTVALKASVQPTNATNKNLVWSSSNAKIAKVSNKGVVTGVAVGKVTITAKSNNGKVSNKCTVTVTSGKIFDKPTKVTMMTMSKADEPYDPKWPIWEEIRKATNVDLEVQAYSADYTSKITLALASRNMPDIIYMTTSQMMQFANDGPFVDVYQNMKYCPNFSRWYNSDKKLADGTLMMFKSSNGKLYMFPIMGAEIWTNVRGFLIRMDLLQKEKIAVPKTYDQLYQVLKVFKKRYPDSYPFAERDILAGNRFLELFATQWNTGVDVYYNYDKKEFKYGAMDSNFIKMLDWFRKLYKEQLVPQDLFTMQVKGWTDLISNNKAFCTLDYLARIDKFNGPMQKINPDFNIDWMAPPKGNVPDGKAIMLKTNYTGQGDVVCNTPNKVNALKFIDWLYSEDGVRITNWGTEGLTYRVSQTTGKKEMIKGVTIKYGIRSFGVNIGQDPEAISGGLSQQEKDSHYKALSLTTKEFNPRWFISFNKEEGDIRLQYEEALRNKTDQFISKYVTGEIGADQFDAYCKEMKALGVDKFISIYESAYTRYQN